MKGNNRMKKKLYISPMTEVSACLQPVASTCVASLRQATGEGIADDAV